jgi:uncharacterized protein
MNAQNVFGGLLKKCSQTNKVTGWKRDGFCSTDEFDRGNHCVCSVMTKEFLEYTKKRGNDLSTPIKNMFPGLEPGDRWCLCTLRWLEAEKAGFAPPVVLESTNKKALEKVPLETLEKYAFKE